MGVRSRGAPRPIDVLVEPPAAANPPRNPRVLRRWSRRAQRRSLSPRSNSSHWSPRRTTSTSVTCTTRGPRRCSRRQVLNSLRGQRLDVLNSCLVAVVGRACAGMSPMSWRTRQVQHDVNVNVSDNSYRHCDCRK